MEVAHCDLCETRPSEVAYVLRFEPYQQLSDRSGFEASGFQRGTSQVVCVCAPCSGNPALFRELMLFLSVGKKPPVGSAPRMLEGRELTADERALWLSAFAVAEVTGFNGGPWYCADAALRRMRKGC